MNIYDILLIGLYIFTVFTFFSIPIFFKTTLNEFNLNLSEKLILLFFHIILSILVFGWTTRSLVAFLISFILCVYPTITIAVFTLSSLRYIEKLETRIKEITKETQK